MDCPGHVATSTAMMVVFYNKSAGVTNGVTYRYPTDSGFPQFRVEDVALGDDGTCYQCVIFHTDLFASVRMETHLTVYGQYTSVGYSSKLAQYTSIGILTSTALDTLVQYTTSKLAQYTSIGTLYTSMHRIFQYTSITHSSKPYSSILELHTLKVLLLFICLLFVVCLFVY